MVGGRSTELQAARGPHQRALPPEELQRAASASREGGCVEGESIAELAEDVQVVSVAGRCDHRAVEARAA